MAALDRTDMKTKWVFPPDTEEGDKLELDGIYGTPLAAGDSVYFGAYDGNVYALAAEDGSERWTFETDGPLVGAVTAQMSGEGVRATVQRLFVGSEDGHVYALAPDNGSPAWTFDAGDRVWTAPLLLGDSLYVAAVNGKLYALDPADGQERWAFETDAALLTDPVAAGADTVLVGGIDQRLHAVDAGTGKERWSFKGGSWFWGRPLVDGDTVYAPNLDHKVYALKLADGSLAWQEPFRADASVRSAPLLADGVLIVIDRKGNVSGLDPQAGTLNWSAPAALAKTVYSDPLLLDEPTEVLIVAEGGDLFTVEPQTGAVRAAGGTG